MKTRIILYGPPGSGKSAVGRALAESLAKPFVDLDEAISTQAGISIPEIFASEGEAGFRNRERAALQEALSSRAEVIALGGGTLLDPESRSRVEGSGRVILLQASQETLHSRLQSASVERPLLGGEMYTRLEGLLARRLEHYASFPCSLITDGRTPEDLAWEIQVRLGRFTVQGMGHGYDVFVEPGALGMLGEYLADSRMGGPSALVSDATVSQLYAGLVRASLERYGYAVQSVVIPPGEAHKTLESIAKIWEGFLEGSLERGSSVVALGGGVVGDLAGFAAATFLRGVAWANAPTTLLAMVDASLGGKTGADLPQGKNLIGAFHPPRLVLADPDVLVSLPEEELRSGLAEVVKHGVIGDSQLFNLCEAGWQAVCANLDEVIRRGMAVKVRVIQADPYEKGHRAALNLGHTVGHGIEKASGFRLRHGEAVSIGMVIAARLSERFQIAEHGLAERIERVLYGLGLPTHIPEGIDRGAVLQAMRVDKKRQAGSIRFALPVRVGEVRIGIPVEDFGFLWEG